MPLGHNKAIYMYMYMLHVCLQQLFASQYCKRCDINLHGTVLHVHTCTCIYSMHVHVHGTCTYITMVTLCSSSKMTVVSEVSYHVILFVSV